MKLVSEPWQRNLYAIFIGQLFVMMGFNFASPFLPLFIQELGNYTNEQAAFWSGIATAGLGIAMFFSAPLWGIVADRWGRKPMVLRAQFCSAFILGGLALSPNVYWVVGLRILQGFFSGTMTAAQAMVAGETPRDKMPFAMGLLMTAMFTGNTVGPLLGGALADAFGYRPAFYITGALLFTGGVVVFFFTKENFVRPEKTESVSIGSLLRLAFSRQMLPLLLTLCALQLGPQMLQPVIPVLIREIEPTARAATMSGIAFCLMGVVAAVSSLFSSRLAKRISLKKMLIISCIGTGLLYLPPAWASTAAMLIFFLALAGVFKGGLMMSSNALVGLSAMQSQQGMAYGVAQSANSLGVAIGPLLGGVLSPVLGIKSVFIVAAGIFVAIGLAVSRFLRDIKLEQPR